MVKSVVYIPFCGKGNRKLTHGQLLIGCTKFSSFWLVGTAFSAFLNYYKKNTLFQIFNKKYENGYGMEIWNEKLRLVSNLFQIKYNF